jgi:hypothetical protein
VVVLVLLKRGDDEWFWDWREGGGRICVSGSFVRD